MSRVHLCLAILAAMLSIGLFAASTAFALEESCSTLGLKNEGPEEECRFWEGKAENIESGEESGEEESEAKSTEEEALGHNPIVFVHGIFGNKKTFKTMVSWFKADGWSSSRLLNWAYNWKQSNVTIAKEVQAKVELLLKRTHAKKIDIITHSMGALSSRYYLKNLLGGGKEEKGTVIDEWVSLGGPNHGASIAKFCAWLWTSCAEMVPGSAFLKQLNEIDETPGTVRYGTWYSNGSIHCDFVVPSGVSLTGAAQNTEKCITHWGWHENKAIYEEVRNFVRF